MKRTKTIGTLILSGLGATGVAAQDFYNGQPGPTNTQVDVRVQATDGDVNGVIIPKYFGRDWLVAAPFNDEGENLGVNVGRIQNISKGNDMIGALGLFRDGNGDYRALDVQAYFTNMHGRWTTDLEAGATFHTTEHDLAGRASATLGYGVTDRLRLGGSVAFAEGKEPDFQAIARFDFPRKGTRHWLQVYGKKDTIGFRFAYNSRIKKSR